MANKKARRIPPTVKSQVAELAHSEPGMGSSAKVIAAMIRFRVKGRSVASASAKAWASVRCGRYFAKGKQLLQVPRSGTFFSLVSDQSRVNKRGVILTALWCSALCTGFWLPPQVLRHCD